MDYKTLFIVGVLLGLPTIVLVISKLIEKIRQSGNDSTVLSRDPESGEVDFGDGLSGREPTTSKDERHDPYEHGGGRSQLTEHGLTTMEVFDYLEDAVTCRDPSINENFDKKKKRGGDK